MGGILERLQELHLRACKKARPNPVALANLAGKTVLVTGATGQQGGATARHLLARGAAVRALVRDPRSPAARRLASIGAELVVGDMDDGVSLRTAMRGAYGAFSVQPARIPPSFAENELGRGLNVVDAAHAVGLHHLVYSSVAGANRSTGIPHWEVKGRSRSASGPRAFLSRSCVRPCSWTCTRTRPTA